MHIIEYTSDMVSGEIATLNLHLMINDTVGESISTTCCTRQNLITFYRR
jgi:hypothetical protein